MYVQLCSCQCSFCVYAPSQWSHLSILIDPILRPRKGPNRCATTIPVRTEVCLRPNRVSKLPPPIPWDVSHPRKNLHVVVFMGPYRFTLGYARTWKPSYLGDPIVLHSLVILSRTKRERTKLQRITNIKWGLPSLADVNWLHVQIKQNYWCISILHIVKIWNTLKISLYKNSPCFRFNLDHVGELLSPKWFVMLHLQDDSNSKKESTCDNQSNGFALWSAKWKTEEIWSQNT